MKNIIETITANSDLSTLLTAIKKAELVDTLSNKGPFTVFTPNNKAFEKIAKKNLDELLADKTKLVSTLTYHVVSGKIASEILKKMAETKTIEGSKILIGTENEVSVTRVSTPDISALEMNTSNGISINDANITKADIECSNGIIHIIDTLLIPKN